MALFPSNTGTKQDTLTDAWIGARNSAAGVKQAAQTLRAQSVAGPVDSSALLAFASFLATHRANFARYAVVPGIGAFAQNQIGDATFDVVASFNAMVAAMDALRDWMIANFPKDGNGFLLAATFDGSARTVARTFTTATLATFRTQLDTLIATID